MSSKQQIRETVKHEGVAYDKMMYSCNCGWLDFTHLYPSGSSDPHVGAVNLWKQLQNGDQQPAAKPYYCGGYVERQGPPPDLMSAWINCRNDGLAHFPDGKTGFRVIYKQDQGMSKLGVSLRTDREKEYLVRYGLTEQIKKRVALSIFMEISILFENMQGEWPQPWLSDSSFSREDLVSNLIGFYVAVGEIKYQDVGQICKTVPREVAEALWPEDGLGSAANKNYEFSPKLEQDFSKFGENNPCLGQPVQFPAVFSRIKPAPLGQWHMQMPLSDRF